METRAQAGGQAGRPTDIQTSGRAHITINSNSCHNKLMTWSSLRQLYTILEYACVISTFQNLKCHWFSIGTQHARAVYCFYSSPCIIAICIPAYTFWTWRDPASRASAAPLTSLKMIPVPDMYAMYFSQKIKLGKIYKVDLIYRQLRPG